jgi:hypothetical protein
MIVEPMLQLYQLTGETKFLSFSEYIYEKLKYHNKLLLDHSLYLHGVHVAENVRIPALIYQFNNNPDYLETSRKGIELISKNYVNSVGAIRSDEMVAYAVPNRAAEFCTITEWILTTSAMARITGEMHYADLAEKCFFNAAQGARLPNGKGIQYLSYPNQLYTGAPGPYKEQVAYKPNHYPLCCNPNAGRLFPYYIGSMFMKFNLDGIAAMFFGPSELTTTIGKNSVPLVIEQQTDYPFDEHITFKIKPKAEATFPFFLRIPGWCQNAVVSINGEKQEIEIMNGMVRLERLWQDGDQIKLILPMSISLDYTRSEMVSVNRGPLVYAFAVPSDMVAYNEAAPGFPVIKYVMKEDAVWNYALNFSYPELDEYQWRPSCPFDNVNISESFEVEELAIPENSLPWEYPHCKVKCKARVYPAWKIAYENTTDDTYFYKRQHILKQPEIPPAPALYRFLVQNKAINVIELVPFGTTRLRIVSFPYILPQ